ncbi:acireductone synthase [Haliscomenobacter hydrossis]|uniref:Enolase-phosphatase E1 n=1 Tax=Haliscomenobacter hydrossis (strain ATCC 27775 / DSM 1100 / LMG 10767 / O) TaxID=760192 RepID=F4L0C7_HALH1|nr:acireductone synthase [Haliscomenobacter hydrossis]AEE53800.1 Enolase-phosphatase E1 [Haliscomenobacter hydrossis DSM 1100]
MQFILTDIEGTTTDINFVHQVLFPFSSEKLRAFVKANASDPVVAQALAQTSQTLLEENLPAENLEDLIEGLLAWIKSDRKHPALKQLQGLIWREGYESGGFKGHVYPDVVPALERWKQKGYGLGIYSSGSVAAQKLLFGFSDYGDLNGFFTHNFDTAVGHKREVASYQNIATQLGIPTSEILFLSDIEEELDAAKVAGMQCLQLLRPGTIPSMRHPGVRSFAEIE